MKNLLITHHMLQDFDEDIHHLDEEGKYEYGSGNGHLGLFAINTYRNRKWRIA